MPVDIEVCRQPLANHSNQPLLRQCRPPPGKLKNRHADENVLRPEQWVGDSRRQPTPQRCRHGVHCGQVEHVGGRALQHGDVGGALRHFRNQGDRGCAAADDDYPLARIVQPLGPELRMHHRALERRLVRKVRAIGRLVIVVAAAKVEKSATKTHRSPVAATRFDRPARGAAAPCGLRDPGPEADMRIDARLARRVDDVAPDRFSLRDRIGVGPRPKGVAERVHVGVGAHAGKFEQIPGPADGAARLEDGVCFRRATALKMDGGANARQPGADDQHVERFEYGFRGFRHVQDGIAFRPCMIIAKTHR